jgi:4-oxalocrotonate tautomerase
VRPYSRRFVIEMSFYPFSLRRPVCSAESSFVVESYAENAGVGEETSLTCPSQIMRYGGSLPLFTLSLEAGRTREEKRQLADAVYDAMRAAIQIPDNDRFVAIREHAAGDLVADPGYPGVARSEHPVFVEITLRRGRPTERKQALYSEIARRMSATGLVQAKDVLIVLKENHTTDWSFGGGVAQYVEAEQKQGRAMSEQARRYGCWAS